MTTDNTDLLTGAPVAAPVPVAAPRKRGRPAKAAPVAPVAPPASDLLNNHSLVNSAAPAPDATDTEIPVDFAPPPSDLDGLTSVPEADGSVSVELPPVSPEYAAAMAHRPIIIGQTRRTYAYQRLMRQGKKL